MKYEIKYVEKNSYIKEENPSCESPSIFGCLDCCNKGAAIEEAMCPNLIGTYWLMNMDETQKAFYWYDFIKPLARTIAKYWTCPGQVDHPPRGTPTNENGTGPNKAYYTSNFQCDPDIVSEYCPDTEGTNRGVKQTPAGMSSSLANAETCGADDSKFEVDDIGYCAGQEWADRTNISPNKLVGEIATHHIKFVRQTHNCEERQPYIRGPRISFRVARDIEFEPVPCPELPVLNDLWKEVKEENEEDRFSGLGVTTGEFLYVKPGLWTFQEYTNFLNHAYLTDDGMYTLYGNADRPWVWHGHVKLWHHDMKQMINRIVDTDNKIPLPQSCLDEEECSSLPSSVLRYEYKCEEVFKAKPIVNISFINAIIYTRWLNAKLCKLFDDDYRVCCGCWEQLGLQHPLCPEVNINNVKGYYGEP